MNGDDMKHWAPEVQNENAGEETSLTIMDVRKLQQAFRKGCQATHRVVEVK